MAGSVIDGRHQLLVAGPHLHRQRTLPRLGHECVRVEREPDPSLQAQPDQAGGGQEDHVGLTGVQLAQPRVDVAAQRHHLEVGAQLAQKAGSTRRRRRRPWRLQVSRPASAYGPQQASRGSARSGTAAEHQPVGHLAGQVLGAVHGGVDLAVAAAPARSRAVKTPRPSPIWSNGASLSRSPAVEIGTISAPARASIGHQSGLRQRQRAGAAAKRSCRGAVETEQLGHGLRIRLGVAVGGGLLQPHRGLDAGACPASTRVTASSRARSAGVSPSQRPSARSSSATRICSARARSEVIAGTTSSAASQRRNSPPARSTISRAGAYSPSRSAIVAPHRLLQLVDVDDAAPSSVGDPPDRCRAAGRGR